MDFIRKIFRERTASILFIIGLAISSFVLISIMDYITKIQVEENALHQYKYEISFEVEKNDGVYYDNESEDIEKMVESLSAINKGNVMLSGGAFLDNTDRYVDSYILMVQNEPIHIACKNNYDITRENSVLIGEDLEPYVFISDDKKMINLNGMNWEVAGILKNYMAGGIDERAFMFVSNMSKEYYEKQVSYLLDWLSCQLLSNENIVPVYEAYKKEMVNNGFSVDTFDYDDDMYTETYKMVKGIYAVLGIVFSVLNCFTVSYLWLVSRKKEIAIRKAYGYGTSKLLILIFRDILINSLVGVILSTLIQIIFSVKDNVFIFNNFGMKMGCVFLGMIAISALIMLKLVNDIIKVPPVNMINGGGKK